VSEPDRTAAELIALRREVIDLRRDLDEARADLRRLIVRSDRALVGLRPTRVEEDDDGGG